MCPPSKESGKPGSSPPVSGTKVLCTPNQSGSMSVLFDKRFMEMLSSQTVSVVGGLLAGALLVIFTDRLLYLPGMLIFIPGFLEMRGNISGTFASRLSSGLFLGIIKPNRFHTKLIHGNLVASFVLALIASAVLGILAFLLTGMLSGAFLPK